jgi:hypothetical protein
MLEWSHIIIIIIITLFVRTKISNMEQIQNYHYSDLRFSGVWGVG